MFPSQPPSSVTAGTEGGTGGVDGASLRDVRVCLHVCVGMTRTFIETKNEGTLVQELLVQRYFQRSQREGYHTFAF